MERQVKAHIYNVHKNETKPFDCKMCPIKFRSQYDLRKHETCVHEKQKNYKCVLCVKTFGGKSYLTRHVKSVHEKVRPY